MALTTTPFPLALPPRPRGPPATKGLYEYPRLAFLEGRPTKWLYESLRLAILEGRLRAGSRLPTTRELAREQGVARGTVVTAFENLKAEGYLNATVGSGTYVACELPERSLQAPRATAK